MNDIVIVGAARTPIGKFGGTLKGTHPSDLGALVINEALKRSGVSKEQVDEVIMGCVGQIAENAFIARMSAINAGIPESASAMTVNRLCGSGLQAINSAAQCLAAGDEEIIVAGGTENMNQYPYYLRKAREGYGFGDGKLEDGLVTALTDPFNDYQMGVTAENLAEKYGISRERQDEFSYNSQMKAIAAIERGRFKDEIVSVNVHQKKGEDIILSNDEHPRKSTTLEKLSALKPAFKNGGSVTAGNASGINDGAAAVVMMTLKKAKELNLRPLAFVRQYAVAGVEPSIMGIGPAPAVNKALEKSGITLEEIDLIELNEAFAAQSLAVIEELGLDKEKVNVNGGAIALGHPVGASGCIITVKLIHEMKRRNVRYGLASLCIGGGQGIATIFENYTEE
ncbi:thiolase family protein [Corticicoccus populi]|uniref:Probable acetyl-CoA acyltransferase n=1 Tax=Corticicoccus populi TaxID=1812821 RepID=A0ABW5X0V0_9STAP